MSAVNRAIEIVGSAAELARRIGVTTQAISQWDRVPIGRVIAVCRAADWKVTPNDLRPDLYPNRSDGLPSTDDRDAA